MPGTTHLGAFSKIYKSPSLSTYIATGKMRFYTLVFVTSFVSSLLATIAVFTMLTWAVDEKVHLMQKDLECLRTRWV